MWVDNFAMVPEVAAQSVLESLILGEFSGGANAAWHGQLKGLSVNCQTLVRPSLLQQTAEEVLFKLRRKCR